jgi:transposase
VIGPCGSPPAGSDRAANLWGRWGCPGSQPTDAWAGHRHALASGLVISQMTPRHRAIEFKGFLDRVDQAVPAGLDVHVICDNSSTHKTPAIRRWLAAHPRFHVHFTPTYSSWLNLVERWFAELTTKWLKRGSHRSVPELTASIQDWIETWNQEPRPFVWTKTADQILDSIARYLQPISNSGH